MSAQYSGAPRPDPGPTEQVIQLGKGETIDCIICSQTIWGVGTHWNDRAGKHGRSERCVKDRGECSGCNGELPLRWKGYLYVYCMARRRCVFVELTPGAAKEIEMQAPPNKPFRGERLKLRRGQGGKQSRLYVEILEYRGDVDALPAEKDPEPILETLWRWGR